MILMHLLQEMFFIPCDSWKILIFIRVYHYFEVSFNRHVAVFFPKIVLQKFGILSCCLHSNISSITKNLLLLFSKFFIFYLIK